MSSNSEMSNDIDVIVANAIQSIICHYNQKIHVSHDKEQIPYFDSLLGKPYQHTSITKHWVECLNRCCADNDKLHFQLSIELLDSYSSKIRSECFRFTRKRTRVEDTAFSVLFHYEIILNGFLSERIENDNCVGETKFIRNIHKVAQVLFNDILMLTSIEKIHLHNMTINKEHDEIFRMHSICNLILPTLLRIFCHLVRIFGKIITLSSNRNKLKDLDTKKAEILTYGLLVAASFCSNMDCIDSNGNNESNHNMASSNLSINEILPIEWKEGLTLGCLMDTCSYSPNHLSYNKSEDYNTKIKELINSNISESQHLMNLVENNGSTEKGNIFLKQPIINFDDSSSASLTMLWIDNIKGVGFRAARALLSHLDIMASYLTENTSEYPIKAVTVFERIIHAIGLEAIIPMVRANFFGRLDISFTLDDDSMTEDTFDQKMNLKNSLAFNGIYPAKNSSDEMSAVRSMKQLTIRKKLEKNPTKRTYLPGNANDMIFSEDQPFNQIQARIVATIRLLSSLNRPYISNLVWSQSLPIIYTLIDSHDSSHQSLGGALLLHLIKECESSSFVSSGEVDKKKNDSTFFETTLQLLSMACRTCDDPVPLSILLEVQCRILNMSDDISSSYKRIFASDILSRIKKQSYCGPNGEERIVSCIATHLICGLHGVLVQLANKPNADSIEIGRIGLSALLPLIRWDSTSKQSRQIQFASISCLISLMMGSYPIMERHGGKIMSELIACVGRDLRDIRIHEEVNSKINNRNMNMPGNTETLNEFNFTKNLIAFAMHAASVALILCGTRANDVLEKLENGKFDSDVISCCKVIRFNSSKMM